LPVPNKVETEFPRPRSFQRVTPDINEALPCFEPSPDRKPRPSYRDTIWFFLDSPSQLLAPRRDQEDKKEILEDADPAFYGSKETLISSRIEFIEKRPPPFPEAVWPEFPVARPV